MAHFLCHLGCSHFGALLLDFYFTENKWRYIHENDGFKMISICDLFRFADALKSFYESKHNLKEVIEDE